VASPSGRSRRTGRFDAPVEASAAISTGMEAIAFFRKEGHSSSIKFVYLKHKDTGDDFRPYDLEVVPLDAVGSNYYIMSAQGVTHIIQPDVKIVNSGSDGDSSVLVARQTVKVTTASVSCL
jgi:hypothetical protein